VLLDAVEQVVDGELDTVQIDKQMRVAGRTALPVRVTLLLLEEPGGQRHHLAQIQDLSPPPGEAELTRQAEQDSLTGLGNRRLAQPTRSPAIRCWSPSGAG